MNVTEKKKKNWRKKKTELLQKVISDENKEIIYNINKNWKADSFENNFKRHERVNVMLMWLFLFYQYLSQNVVIFLNGKYISGKQNKVRLKAILRTSMTRNQKLHLSNYKKWECNIFQRYKMLDDLQNLWKLS